MHADPEFSDYPLGTPMWTPDAEPDEYERTADLERDAFNNRNQVSEREWKEGEVLA